MSYFSRCSRCTRSIEAHDDVGKRGGSSSERGSHEWNVLELSVVAVKTSSVQYMVVWWCDGMVDVNSTSGERRDVFVMKS